MKRRDVRVDGDVESTILSMRPREQWRIGKKLVTIDKVVAFSGGGNGDVFFTEEDGRKRCVSFGQIRRSNLMRVAEALPIPPHPMIDRPKTQ